MTTVARLAIPEIEMARGVNGCGTVAHDLRGAAVGGFVGGFVGPVDGVGSGGTLAYAGGAA